jgi:transketolase
MMIPAVLAVFLATGCTKAMDDQIKADNSQTEADKKIAAAAAEAQQKGEAAQAEADKSIAAAKASFMKLREDYRHQTMNNLVELDHRVDVLDATSKASTAPNRAALDANLEQIHAKRSAFGANYAALESATAITWDDAKSRLEKDWAELKGLVDRA